MGVGHGRCGGGGWKRGREWWVSAFGVPSKPTPNLWLRNVRLAQRTAEWHLLHVGPDRPLLLPDHDGVVHVGDLEGLLARLGANR